MKIEVTLWIGRFEDVVRPWRTFRPPVRFENLDAYAECRLKLRAGRFADYGPVVRADRDGVAVVDDHDVAEFIQTIATFPVLIQGNRDQTRKLRWTAYRRQIPYWPYLGGLGFRSHREAVLVKMLTP